MLDWVSDGRSLAMLRRWKNERVLSRMTPRLLTLEEKGTGNPSMIMSGAGVCCDLVRVDLDPYGEGGMLVDSRGVH